MITPRTVRRVVEAEFQLDISARDRSTPYLIARKIYSISARRFTSHSLTIIGKEIERDHATIVHHLKDSDVFERNFPEARASLARVTKGLYEMQTSNLERPATLAIQQMEMLAR